MPPKKSLAPAEAKQLLATLKSRFEKIITATNL